MTDGYTRRQSVQKDRQTDSQTHKKSSCVKFTTLIHSPAKPARRDTGPTASMRIKPTAPPLFIISTPSGQNSSNAVYLVSKTIQIEILKKWCRSHDNKISDPKRPDSQSPKACQLSNSCFNRKFVDYFGLFLMKNSVNRLSVGNTRPLDVYFKAIRLKECKTKDCTRWSKSKLPMCFLAAINQIAKTEKMRP
ncbi:hypothetical protein FF38_09003 [Lucilia cuprina]|uniref:Uncharacterized protein n=1 Tax=Lucilia cuprina TaxID=7375 RepID=A0A0L0CNH3_LUCCU|nr:hypothetical protein FF38_09003 [Lucilia cuprina]